jgi:uncharacterized protein
MKTILNNFKIMRANGFSSIFALVAYMCTIVTSSGQNADNLKLKDYRPVSIYKIPVTNVLRAKYTAIDVHVHGARNDETIAQNIKVMDACGIEKAIILSGASGARFDAIVNMYAKYGNRFEIWCGFDYTGYDKPGYGPEAVKELERCVKNGAKGVGELMFKGKGSPPSSGRSIILPDDPRLDPLFEKCADLKVPVNLHVAEDIWMYEKIDSTNDGLMNASKWQVKSEYGTKTHQEMINSLENTIRKHPRTTFIAAHLADCCADLAVLGNFFDKYPNFFADIAARLGEIAPIPKFSHEFIEKYQDRIVYGTDFSAMNEKNYRVTFRVQETADEHFYDYYQYHSPMYGLYLSDVTLKKLYKDNIVKIMNRK